MAQRRSFPSGQGSNQGGFTARARGKPFRWMRGRGRGGGRNGSEGNNPRKWPLRKAGLHPNGADDQDVTSWSPLKNASSQEGEHKAQNSKAKKLDFGAETMHAIEQEIEDHGTPLRTICRDMQLAR